MSKHRARRVIAVIIWGYIIVLFCMFPIGYDFEFNFQTQDEEDVRNYDSVSAEVITEFVETIEETKVSEDVKQEDDTQENINTTALPTPSNAVQTEEPEQTSELVQTVEEEQPSEEPEEIIPISTIDSRLPGAVFLHIDESSPESPIILSEVRISELDILVDLSVARDPSLLYAVSEALEVCISKIVYREAGTQSFLGKVFVAEGLVNRMRSGVYGVDILAILQQGGYGAEMDEEGNYHVFHSDGREVFEVPEADIAAARVALNGSILSNTVLAAVTDMRNNQYGLSLGRECYRYGCIYHYNPDLVSDKALNARTINRVPVSFHYMDHVFYGYWLNVRNAMHII